MGIRDRLRRLQAKADEVGIMLYQRDGTVRRFGVMEAHAAMFLARTELLKNISAESAVMDAVRNATPESRAAFEERFGPIAFTEYIITPKSRGGQVEARTLTEDGRVERVLYEGDSEEATLVREGARAGTISELPEELPRPPVAGRWVEGLDENLSKA